MGKEISRQVAEQALEKAIANFDWDVFFMDDKIDFLTRFRAFHAQLRDGDKLEIEISTRERDDYHHPDFNLVLHKSSGEREVVYSEDEHGSVGNDMLLYEDKITIDETGRETVTPS